MAIGIGVTVHFAVFIDAHSEPLVHLLRECVSWLAVRHSNLHHQCED